jgi:small subunit ribosomal protein S17
MIGTVASDKMQKGCTVRVERRYKHPKYGKYVVASTKYIVHDENNEARAGDRVEISETRPLSKNKRFRLLNIIERAESLADSAPDKSDAAEEAKS